MHWKELPQLQFAYRSPQGTVKPSTCEYSTNKQITCWQGEMQKRCSNLAEGRFLAPHLQFHRHLLNFKDISAPLIFDQAVYSTVRIYSTCEYVVSAMYKWVYWQVWQIWFLWVRPLPLQSHRHLEKILVNVNYKILRQIFNWLHVWKHPASQILI